MLPFIICHLGGIRGKVEVACLYCSWQVRPWSLQRHARVQALLGSAAAELPPSKTACLHAPAAI